MLDDLAECLKFVGTDHFDAKRYEKAIRRVADKLDRAADALRAVGSEFETFGGRAVQSSLARDAESGNSIPAEIALDVIKRADHLAADLSILALFARDDVQRLEKIRGHRRGRKPLKDERSVILIAASIYLELTGKKPGRSRLPDSTKRTGPFIRFTMAFAELVAKRKGVRLSVTPTLIERTIYDIYHRKPIPRN